MTKINFNYVALSDAKKSNKKYLLALFYLRLKASGRGNSEKARAFEEEEPKAKKETASVFACRDKYRLAATMVPAAGLVRNDRRE